MAEKKKKLLTKEDLKDKKQKKRSELSWYETMHGGDKDSVPSPLAVTAVYLAQKTGMLDKKPKKPKFENIDGMKIITEKGSRGREAAGSAEKTR